MNPYTNYQIPSYFAQLSPDEQAKLMPSFQNLAQQNSSQDMANQQAMQLTQQAGQTVAQSGPDPMALAAALRKRKKEDSATPMADYAASNPNVYGGGDTMYG